MSDVAEISDEVRQQREDEAFIKDFVSRGAGGDGAGEEPATPEKQEHKKEVKVEGNTPVKTPVADDTEHRDDDALDSDDADEMDPDEDAGESETAEGTDAGEEDDEHPETDSATADKAFSSAMEQQGVSFTKLLADVPDAYKPLLEKKAKELQAGFTKARQADREQFKDTVTLRAEMRLMKERPADLIVEQILKSPALAEQINAKLDQLQKMDELDGTPGTATAAHSETVKRAREKAVTTEETAAVQADTEARRIDAITQAGMRAARAAGVPFEAGVEDAIAAQLALGHLDITPEEIEKIAKEKAAVWQRSTRAVTREASKAYVKQKAKDRRTGGLAIKPNAGSSAAPTGKSGPQTDDEFVAYMRDKYK